MRSPDGGGEDIFTIEVEAEPSLKHGHHHGNAGGIYAAGGAARRTRAGHHQPLDLHRDRPPALQDHGGAGSGNRPVARGKEETGWIGQPHNAIIDQFIDYVRQERQPTASAVDLNALVQEVADELLVEQAPQLQLGESALVSGNSVALKRMVTNLMENAARHGGGVIEVETYQQQDKLVLRIMDNGPGIPPALIEQLFEPFARGDSARGSSGSGLGLTIVRRIVARHGGVVSISNRPQGGLCAEVWLPVAGAAPVGQQG